MFFAEAQIRVRLYGQPTDMRKSYDGLQALARHAMGHDPLDGARCAPARWIGPD
jgi:transposase